METVVNYESLKDKVLSFVWQHTLLVMSLFVMTLGVALCVRSALGCSVISTIPFVMSQAGQNGMAPAWTIGEYTFVMNGLLVLLQVLILRKKFEPVQLFQLFIGFFFGYLLDVNMSLTAMFDYSALLTKIVAQLAGCTILAVGISLEIRCGSVTMPGEGITVAISRVSGLPFPKAKIYVDSALVIAAVALCYVFFGHWLWNVVGLATLFAMFYVGFAVKIINPHLGWFSHMVCSRPGFKRYVYGLARFLRHNQDSSDS
ncbi:MAG: hypothetical protein K2L39_00815 [Muribaculaceae bacterium]|nr:hypothetical protein [Muribaculaceae bacterium]